MQNRAFPGGSALFFFGCESGLFRLPGGVEGFMSAKIVVEAIRIVTGVEQIVDVLHGLVVGQ